MVELKITIKIADAKVNDFKLAFKKVMDKNPKPPEYEGLTDVQLFRAFIKNYIFSLYKTGKILIAQENTPPDIDLNIIEVT